MKTYRLQKPLPDFPAGTLFENDGEDKEEFYSGQLEEGYADIDMICFSLQTIKRHPDWFEEVKEEHTHCFPKRRNGWGDCSCGVPEKILDEPKEEPESQERVLAEDLEEGDAVYLGEDNKYHKSYPQQTVERGECKHENAKMEGEYRLCPDCCTTMAVKPQPKEKEHCSCTH